jgi:hypothetical protein
MELTVEDAKQFLKQRGYVVLKEKSYRQAQERQRIADVMCEDAKERAASQDRWWREEILPELFEYRDRVTFLYGQARAAGCTVEELEHPATHQEQHMSDNELSDRAEAVLWVLNGKAPASSMERRKGRDMLVTKSGIPLDLRAIAVEVAAFLDSIEERD